MSYKEFNKYVEKNTTKILEVERYLWKHPETGFREWNTTKYLGEIFENAGYKVNYAKDIPGFYADIDTGKPGPKLLIFGEMDALLCPNHPEQVNNCAHACGHNTQCAALVGIALALKEPGALDGLSGSIRLCAVPAEELIEIEYREDLRKQGIIHYLGGKLEYLYRGYLDGCDIAFMNHASTKPGKQFDYHGYNGCMVKTITYTGLASHAGGSPHLGINAMYAATQGLSAINAIRETFKDDEHVRVHPIITSAGSSVNTIPSKATLQSYVRGATLEAISSNNEKVNRALASGALALGATVKTEDRHGFSPMINDEGLAKVVCNVAEEIFGKDGVKGEIAWGSGCTDMGDISLIMRALHAHVSGSSGHGHGDDYEVIDPITACVMSAEIYMMSIRALLENNASKAIEVINGPKLKYQNKEDFFKDIDQQMKDLDMIKYTPNGAEINYK